MAKKANNNRSNTHSSAATGAAIGLAALAAAAAGAYFLYGKDAPKRRAKVRGWALRAKGEVLEAIEQASGTLSEEKYRALVDQVMTRYRKLKQANPEELLALGKELKGHWRNIKKHLSANESGGASRRSAARGRKSGGAKKAGARKASR